MSATAVPASACLSATPICSSVNPFLGILRTSFPGASLPEKLRWDWIRIGGQDHGNGPDIKVDAVESCALVPGGSPSGADVVNFRLPIRNVGNVALESLVTVRTEGSS